MRPSSWITLILGLLLFGLGIYGLVSGGSFGVIPMAIGIVLVYLGYKGGRGPLVIFGHATIIIGCFLVTWGIYLVPYSKPTFAHVFTRPLFWGLFSIFGGLCALFHGFCQCVRRFKMDE